MSITPIIQFGTSRFLQAHADLFISEALSQGSALGPITVVQSSGSASRSHRLAALTASEGFPVHIRGIDRGNIVSSTTQVTSIKRALSTTTDWQEIARIATDEAQVIISNTSDAGWIPQAEDHSAEFRQAMSFPAKLMHLLRARYIKRHAKLTILPTELVSRNGDRLRERVLHLAAKNDRALADWIADNIIFANSLVDRIVSEPIEPAGAVAEPYALWAIEASDGLILPCKHPAIKLVPSLERYEKLKLHILNLGHTYLVARWLAEGGTGEPIVRDHMNDATIRRDLESLYRDEVLPIFAAAGYADEASKYMITTLDRFSNPFINHKLSDIAENHAEKVQRRIGALLEWGTQLAAPPHQPRLQLITKQVRENK